LGLEGFGPQDWDLGLKTGFWDSTLELGPGGWDLKGGTEKKEKEKEKEKKEKEKIPHMCESICQRRTQKVEKDEVRSRLKQ